MPTFQYTAKRSPSEVIEGTVEAENRSGVLRHLAGLGYIPVRISEQSAEGTQPAARPATPVRPTRIPAVHFTVFTRQFASLVHSFVPLLRALQILEEQAKPAYLRYVLHQLAEEVRQGQSLSSAMAQYPRVFSPLYVNLIHSGEITGALDVVLEQLAQQTEYDEAWRTKVRMAFVYPASIGVFALLTVMFLMTFVIPRLSRLLAGLGARLPLPTRVLLAVSAWMSTPWCWGLAVCVGFLGVGLWKSATVRHRLVFDRLILRVPLLGPLVLQSEIARFARSLGLQLRHGITILQAIDVATKVVTHRLIGTELQRLSEGLRQGNTLSSGLKALSVSSPLLVNAVAVGEETGRVGEALTEVAAYYEREAERTLQALATLLEPMLVVVVGLIVGGIVMAVLLPIFEMGTINP